MSGAATVLLATVGGSHQPIVTAIAEATPARVVFLCTDREPATGRPGSRTQVEGAGLCLKGAPGDEKATLTNIPAIAKLAPDTWSVAIVPADDLDEAYAAMGKAIREARTLDPAARLVADYTGGTKTMSAELVLAALDAGDAELRLVTGARSDLVKVRDGTQTAAPARADAIRLRRDMATFLGAWARHAGVPRASLRAHAARGAGRGGHPNAVRTASGRLSRRGRMTIEAPLHVCVATGAIQSHEQKGEKSASSVTSRPDEEGITTSRPPRPGWRKGVTSRPDEEGITTPTCAISAFQGV